jgi:hypothetical protein
VAPKRQALESALSTATAELLVEKGYICFVDVFMKLGYLSRADYENWRFGRVPCLERVLTLNLSAINFIMKTVRRNSLNGHLKPSLTVYKSWGKRKKTLLRFSKSGDGAIETAYATHFVKPKRTAHAKAQGDEETSTREGGPFETPAPENEMIFYSGETAPIA